MLFAWRCVKWIRRFDIGSLLQRNTGGALTALRRGTPAEEVGLWATQTFISYSGRAPAAKERRDSNRLEVGFLAVGGGLGRVRHGISPTKNDGLDSQSPLGNDIIGSTNNIRRIYKTAKQVAMLE